jgi:L-rhamnose mutarotase
MPRLTQDQWAQIRAERETGASFGDLANRHGVNKAAIVRRAKAENWSDGIDVAEAVRRKVTEKITGMSPGADPKRKAEAMDAEAEKVAEVVRRHRKEWEQVVMLRQEALHDRKANASESFTRAKLAKITAEMTAIQQQGERKAWGLDHQAEVELTITNRRSFTE